MKKRFWVGGLVLSLGGWASDLLAQDGAWRPANAGPTPVTLSASELQPCPAASIGRPVPLPDEPALEREFRLPGAGILPAAYQPPLFPPGSAAPSAKEIPGGETLPNWSEVDDEKHPSRSTEGGFAIGRIQPAPPQRVERTPVKQAALDPLLVLPDRLPTPDRLSSPRDGVPSLPTMRPLGDDYPRRNPYPLPAPLPPGVHESYTPFSDSPPELNRFYLTAEYLLWWAKKDHTPPLVTSSTDGGFGFLNQPNTTVLFSGDLNRDPRSGFRGNAGLWLDDCCQEALEFGGFFLGRRSANFEAASGTDGVLARPFFNVNANTEFSQLVAFPNISTGRILVNAPSSLWGLDTNLRCNICRGCDYRIDLLAGFRFLDLDESLTVIEQIQGLAGAPAPFTNAQTTVVDRFATRNRFYGGQVGVDSEWRRGPWSVDLRAKLALGGTDQRIDIRGGETITDAAGNTSSFNGGLLALSSNSGRFHKSQFSVVPEVGVTLGYQLTDTIRLYAGYNFLYWTRVVRPGDQIDRNLDVTKIPNFAPPGTAPAATNSPSLPFKQSDFWAQGIVLGFEIRY
jgi:hypothetical protein